MQKEVYVISDLHLGGADGFKICTRTQDLAHFITWLSCEHSKNGDDHPIAIELVINGDMVDFLAEKDSPDSNQGLSNYRAFNYDLKLAIAKLRRIMQREAPVFDALQHFLSTPYNRLTLLLGNHDIELALPQVRKVLEQRIGANNGNYQFLHDGEAYLIGSEVLIEHGNEYDDWNRIDYNGLRQLRALYSRHFDPGEAALHACFKAPLGSTLVEKVMNPIKEKWRFIDLLKPEIEGAIPVLTALYHKKHRHISTLLKILYRKINRRSESHIQDLLNEKFGSNTRELLPLETNKPTTPIPFDSDALLAQELGKIFSSDSDYKAYLAALEAQNDLVNDEDTDLETTSERNLVSGLGKLLLGFNQIRALKLALRQLKEKNVLIEADSLYAQSADHLALASGCKYIIFGHTHFSRDHIPLVQSGAHYYNTGTWANLLEFPAALTDLSVSDELTLSTLEKLLDDFRHNRWQNYAVARNAHCHFVKIVLNEATEVQSIALHNYNDYLS